MDVKAAHKSIRVRESDQGLLGIQAGGRYFFYKVCPFGATFQRCGLHVWDLSLCEHCIC